jgi:hypothetical protein
MITASFTMFGEYNFIENRGFGETEYAVACYY